MNRMFIKCLNISGDVIERLDAYFKKLFSLREVENNRGLILVYAVLLINIWVFMNSAYYYLKSGVYQTSCWPFITWCGPIQDAILFNNYLYLRPAVLAFLLFLFVVSSIALIKNKIGLSFIFSFLICLFWLFPIFIFTNNYNDLIHHQHHYLFYVLLIIFFARHSRIQLLIVFYALTYFFSSIPKFTSDTWLLGFVKAPYIPIVLLPFGTIFVILVQLILPYFLLFGSRYIRISAAIFFEAFHIYLAAIGSVGYSFFWITVPMIYILFCEYYERPSADTFRGNSLTTSVFVLFCFLSLVRLIIPGDDQYTMEGSGYALNMFNTATVDVIDYQDKLGKNSTSTLFLTGYSGLLQDLQKNCIDERERSLRIDRVSAYDKYEVVNENNYCKLTYKPFWHNDWINPRLVYQDMSKLNAVQQFILEYKDFIHLSYLTIFILLSFLIISKLFSNNK